MAVSKKQNIGQLIINHVDAQEIIAKMAMGTSISDIAEWNHARYEDLPSLVISEKNLKKFYDEYYDFYTMIREDSQKMQVSHGDGQTDITLALQNNLTYKKAIEEYAAKEVDIKDMFKRLISVAENRIQFIFDKISNDPEDMRPDRTLIEYIRTLKDIVSSLDISVNGVNASTNVNIQNVNIQMVDRHINTVYDIIKQILEGLDYEASQKFTALFSEKMQLLRDQDPLIAPPIETRLESAKDLEKTITAKFLQNQ